MLEHVYDCLKEDAEEDGDIESVAELTCRMMMRKVGILTTDPTSRSSWRRDRWDSPAEGVIRSWPAWQRGSAAYSRFSTPMVRLMAATDRNAKRQPSMPRGCVSPTS